MNQEKELLEQIKEQHATAAGYSSFRAMRNESSVSEIGHDWKMIAERYAKEFAKTELEKVRDALKGLELNTVSRDLGYHSKFLITQDLINKRIEEL